MNAPFLFHPPRHEGLRIMTLIAAGNTQVQPMTMKRMLLLWLWLLVLFARQ